ncbi:MAG: nucleotide sugar epimerase [Candidatus Omnitrophota bacterium]|nr:MAG: nucleotide sugar epimerase [Candidatus Omnitrophota bacterium]
MKKVLLTGCCGFIGWKTTEKLLQKGFQVFGIDDLNDYYDVKLKEWRLSNLKEYSNFEFRRMDICDKEKLKNIVKNFIPDIIINLAARAGVRASIENPEIYFRTNTIGTLNLLEISKDTGIKKFILASTSSIYAGEKLPFSESLPVNNPISPYAASKKAAEVLCYTYHYLYGINITIFRYFTVYGPCGRPDMSIFKFIKLIDEEKYITVYGDGNQSRDFTYIDDIAEGTIMGIDLTGFEIINLGGNRPYKLNQAISLIEKNLGKKAKIEYRPFNKADMKATWADISKAKKLLNWEPKVDLEEGIKRTVKWYMENRNWLKDVKLNQ